MTRVMITGAAGFLGRRLTDAILKKGALKGTGGRERQVSKLYLVDIVDAPLPRSADIEIESVKGDLGDARFVDALCKTDFDSLFHLASFLTFHAEQDPDHAYTVNVTALRKLIDSCNFPAKIVFTSSIAVYGSTTPKVVDDYAPHQPETVYGCHKAISELLIADASRRQRIDGRCLRLPIVLTRPGTAQPAVSDRVASIVREPLNGVDVVAPLNPTSQLALSSAGAVVDALLKLHDLPATDLPAGRAFNLPSLTVTAEEIAAAAARHGATGTVKFEQDAKLQAVVDGWPTQLISERATAFAITADADIDALVSDYLKHKDD